MKPIFLSLALLTSAPAFGFNSIRTFDCHVSNDQKIEEGYTGPFYRLVIDSVESVRISDQVTDMTWSGTIRSQLGGSFLYSADALSTNDMELLISRPLTEFSRAGRVRILHQSGSLSQTVDNLYCKLNSAQVKDPVPCVKQAEGLALQAALEEVRRTGAPAPWAESDGPTVVEEVAPKKLAYRVFLQVYADSNRSFDWPAHDTWEVRFTDNTSNCQLGSLKLIDTFL